MPDAEPGLLGAGGRVYRRVAADQYVFDEEWGRNRPSTQAFVQGGRDGNASAFLVAETTPAAVAALGDEPFMVDVSVDLIREVGLDLERVDDGLPGHVDVVGRKRRSGLKRLVEDSRWVEGYEPPV